MDDITGFGLAGQIQQIQTKSIQEKLHKKWGVSDSFNS